jgi:hypothetical protein
VHKVYICFVLVGKDCPVDFERVLRHVQARCPYRDEIALNGHQIRRATKTFLETDALNECSPEFRTELTLVFALGK